MERITSRHNPLVKRFRDVARAASSDDLMLLDGEHLLGEALGSAIAIEIAAFSESVAEGPAGPLVKRAAEAGARVVLVTDQVLAAMSPVKHPSGAVALATRRESTLDQVLAAPDALILMLHDIQDPGNVGAIVRAAEACGATGIVASAGSADPFGWKALRGAMGSTFRVPTVPRQPLDRTVARAREAGIRIYATVPRGGTLLPAADLRRACAILLGGEGPGLPAALADAADAHLTIPMRRPVESLNVATAAALIVYEAARQRSE